MRKLGIIGKIILNTIALSKVINEVIKIQSNFIWKNNL